MKIRPLVLTLLAFTFVLATPSTRTAFASATENGAYSAKLITPVAGSVVKPGQVVRIEWTAKFPKVDLSMCETEVMISIDGGLVYTYIGSQRNPKIHYYDWTVPDMPKGSHVSAILDIRFGCLGIYAETYSPQVASAFVISNE